MKSISFLSDNNDQFSFKPTLVGKSQEGFLVKSLPYIINHNAV